MTLDQVQGYRLRAGVEMFLTRSGDLYLIPPPGREQACVEAPFGDALARVLGGTRTDPPPELTGVLEALVAEGLVTHAAEPLAFGGEHDRQARYLEQYVGSVDGALEQLRATTLLVLGAGGVGTLAAEFSLRMGIGAVVIVDDDTVEPNNLPRQQFERGDIGRPKAVALAERLRRIDPEAQIASERRQIDSAHTARWLLQRWQPDMLLLCADTPWRKINEWIDEACWDHGVPWVGGGQELPTSVIGPLIVPGQTACATCIAQAGEPDSALVDELAAWRSARDHIVPAVQFADSIIASVMAQTALAYLTGYTDPVLLGRELTIDVHEWRAQIDASAPATCIHTNRARHRRAA